MIKTTSKPDQAITFEDNSDLLDATTLALVKAGLNRAVADPAFRQFTTSVEDGEGRVDWGVRVWIMMENDQVVTFLVAYQILNEHFEVLGERLQ